MQYERLENGYNDDLSDYSKVTLKARTYKVVVASLLATAGVAGVTWSSSGTNLTTSLAVSAPESVPSVQRFEANDRISNVRPSANTQSSSDCPDCSSHTPPALTSSPAKMNKSIRGTTSFFKLSKNGATCDACTSLEDSDCLNLLQSAFSSLDDSEKLPLEKTLLNHKYSCGVSLSDESCLSYLDGKMKTLSNDDELTLLTQACFDGTLAVEAPASDEKPESPEDQENSEISETRPAPVDSAPEMQPAPTDTAPQTQPFLSPTDSETQTQSETTSESSVTQPAPTDSTSEMQPPPETQSAPIDDSSFAPADSTLSTARLQTRGAKSDARSQHMK